MVTVDMYGGCVWWADICMVGGYVWWVDMHGGWICMVGGYVLVG